MPSVKKAKGIVIPAEILAQIDAAVPVRKNNPMYEDPMVIAVVDVARAKCVPWRDVVDILRSEWPNGAFDRNKLSRDWKARVEANQ